MYKEVFPSKWLIILISLFSKVWSTYYNVFMLFGYFLHNKILPKSVQPTLLLVTHEIIHILIQ